MIDPTSYSPFGVVVGYGAAIIAAVTALSVTWQGRLEKWKPPEEDLPNAAQKIVLLLCGVGMVSIWYVAEPKTVPTLIVFSAIMGIVCLSSFLSYSWLIGKYSFSRPVKSRNGKGVICKILGGTTLLPSAARRLNRTKGSSSIQEILEASNWNPDKVWSRDSRQWVKFKVVVLFVLILFSGTLVLTTLGFITQVRLTGKPAAAIVRTTDVTISSELTDFLAGLNRELSNFEKSLNKIAHDKSNPESAKEIKLTIINSIDRAQQSIRKFETARSLNSKERTAIKTAWDRLIEKKQILEDELKEDARKKREETPDNSLPNDEKFEPIEVTIPVRASLHGFPNQIIILGNSLSEAKKSTISEAFKFIGNTVLMPAPTKIPNGGYIEYVASDYKDVSELEACLSYVNRSLEQFETGLSKSIVAKEIHTDKRPLGATKDTSWKTIWVYLP